MIKTNKTKLNEILKLKLTAFAVELIDCGVRNEIKEIKDLAIYILGLTAKNKIKGDIIKAIFELIGIVKRFERRSEPRKVKQ